MTEEVILYSSPTCGVCKMIEGKLRESGIVFRRCYDTSEMKLRGVVSIPTLAVGSKKYNASESYKWIASQGGV